MRRDSRRPPSRTGCARRSRSTPDPPDNPATNTVVTSGWRSNHANTSRFQRRHCVLRGSRRSRSAFCSGQLERVIESPSQPLARRPARTPPASGRRGCRRPARPSSSRPDRRTGTPTASPRRSPGTGCWAACAPRRCWASPSARAPGSCTAPRGRARRPRSRATSGLRPSRADTGPVTSASTGVQRVRRRFVPVGGRSPAPGMGRGSA